jgi:hypothetical protein
MNVQDLNNGVYSSMASMSSKLNEIIASDMMRNQKSYETVAAVQQKTDAEASSNNDPKPKQPWDRVGTIVDTYA